MSWAELSPLKIHRLEPNPPCDGVRGWSLWKLTKVSEVRRVGTHDVISALLRRDSRDWIPLSLPCEDTESH